jgi:hypothetical protein
LAYFFIDRGNNQRVLHLLGTRLRGGSAWWSGRNATWGNYFRIFSPKNRKKKVALRIHSFVIVEGSVGAGTKFSLLRVSKVEKSADRNVCLLHFGCTPLASCLVFFVLLESGLFITFYLWSVPPGRKQDFLFKNVLHFSPQKIFFVIGMTLAIFNALQALKSRKHNRVQHLYIFATQEKG